MQFLYDKNAGEADIEIKSDTFKHLKAQRKKVGECLHVRNLNDEFLYMYNIEQIQRNSAYLSLQSKEKSEKLPFDFTLGWAIVEPKIIEKTLPFLNEIGVKSINFVYSDFSQKHFKLDMQRMQRILINSCQQCGRSKLMEFKVFKNIEKYLHVNPNSYALDFDGKSIQKEKVKEVLVGCEGGFSQRERNLFQNTIGFSSPLILKSETAVIAISSKVML